MRLQDARRKIVLSEHEQVLNLSILEAKDTLSAGNHDARLSKQGEDEGEDGGRGCVPM
jgi:hypothetical protein